MEDLVGRGRARTVSLAESGFLSSPLACTNYVETGDGSLNANSEFSDKVALCSNAPIPACDIKYTQQYTIAQSPPSSPVRTNILEYTNTVLNFTNQGPTQ
jgi:hypothetical protein